MTTCTGAKLSQLHGCSLAEEFMWKSCMSTLYPWIVYQSLQLYYTIFFIFSLILPFFCALCSIYSREMCHGEVTLLGQERSGLNYTDALIRALGKVVLPRCMQLWKVLVNMCVNMYWNNAQKPTEQWKKPRSLCVYVSVSVCVRPLFNMKARETEG